MTMTAAERQQKRRDKLKADPVRLAVEKSQRQKRHLARKANGPPCQPANCCVSAGNGSTTRQRRNQFVLQLAVRQLKAQRGRGGGGGECAQASHACCIARLTA